MKEKSKRKLGWFGTIAVLLLLLLLILRPSSLSENLGFSSDGGDESGASSLTSSNHSEEGRRITPSRRKLSEQDELKAHSVGLDDEESLIFRASGVGEYDGILVNLTPQRFVDEAGGERMILTAKLIDATQSESDDPEIATLMKEGRPDRILDESSEQILLRKLSQTKGADILTLPSQAIERHETVEFLLCPGREQVLLVEGQARQGKDGKTRIQFGDLYIRPRDERSELLESLGLPKLPE